MSLGCLRRILLKSFSDLGLNDVVGNRVSSQSKMVKLTTSAQFWPFGAHPPD